MDYTWQLILNSVSSGGLYFLVAVGFSLIYSTVNFFNFTHGLVFTLAVYLVLALSSEWGSMPHQLAIPIAIIFTGGVGLFLDWAIFGPLRKRKASSLILLLTSLGIYVAGQNSISLLFGDNTQSIRTGSIQMGYSFWGARISPIQLVIVLSAITVFLLVSAAMRKTLWGKAFRATASNKELAELSGIQTNNVISLAVFWGSSIAAVAGILHGYDVDLNPTMGMNPMMAGVVVMIIGGLNSITGIFIGSFFLAVSQQFGAVVVGSQWQDAIAFLVLIIFLTLRPQGILGKATYS